MFFLFLPPCLRPLVTSLHSIPTRSSAFLSYAPGTEPVVNRRLTGRQGISLPPVSVVWFHESFITKLLCPFHLINFYSTNELHKRSHLHEVECFENFQQRWVTEKYWRGDCKRFGEKSLKYGAGLYSDCLTPLSLSSYFTLDKLTFEPETSCVWLCRGEHRALVSGPVKAEVCCPTDGLGFDTHLCIFCWNKMFRIIHIYVMSCLSFYFEINFHSFS